MRNITFKKRREQRELPKENEVEVVEAIEEQVEPIDGEIIQPIQDEPIAELVVEEVKPKAKKAKAKE